MTTNPEDATPPLARLFADDALPELRHAYHALEAFQLSPEHLEIKEALKQRLSSLNSAGIAPSTRTPN